jgi:hypothetical protein
MANTAEKIESEERSLRVVTHPTPEGQAAACPSLKWAELREVLERHRGEKMLVILAGYRLHAEGREHSERPTPAAW